jgi:VanZ family protein
MSKTTSFLWRWGLAILMMTIIFGFSSIPAVELPDFGLVDFLVKKGGHALGYGLLVLTFLRGLKGESQNLHSRWFYIAWVMAVLYSATDEFHQFFVPGRHPAVTDVLIDATSAAIMLLLFNCFRKKATSGTGQPQASGR